MKSVRFLMIGGFLGAGKTTTIGRLAQHYTDQGLNVGIVTNDQAYDLVDTHTLRSQGFQVGEVPGACFCCKFDDLVQTINGLSEDQSPDVVIAEPVGSCTDLFATVIQPMRELLGDRIELGPLVVLLKPEHGKKILGVTKGRGFSPKAEYIFLKQLEEADVIAINKIDNLSAEEQDMLLARIQERFEGVPAFGMSAREGSGFEALVDAAAREPVKRAMTMAMDYETYAEGEAELGWLNCQVTAKAEDKIDLDRLVLDLVKGIGEELVGLGCEVAHLKILGQTLNDTAVANLVGSSADSELSLASEIQTQACDLLVNARVAASPEQLEAAVGNVTTSISDERAIELVVGNMQSFRPAKPEPTHRVEEL